MSQITSFPKFAQLPQELRHYIWTFALPGPRIIHIQHLPVQSSKMRFTSSTPTFFTSHSPGFSIPTLLLTTQESHQIVKRNYSLLFPDTYSWKSSGCNSLKPKDPPDIFTMKIGKDYRPTWFSYEIDFLYLDWGSGSVLDLTYSPQDFGVGIRDPSWRRSYDFLCPDLLEGIVGKVKNLIIHERQHCWVDENKVESADSYLIPPFSTSVEDFLVRLFLGVFSSVEVLVMADRAYDIADLGQEFTWLFGNIGDEFQLDKAMTLQREMDQLNLIEGEMLEKDWKRMKLLPLNHCPLWAWHSCQIVSLSKFEGQWRKWFGTKLRSKPKIYHRIMTTATLKKAVVEICGDENKFWKLKGLGREYIDRVGDYRGDLSLESQIRYMELVLDRQVESMEEPYIDTSFEYGSSGFAENVQKLSGKIQKLKFDLEVQELMVCESEEIESLQDEKLL